MAARFKDVMLDTDPIGLAEEFVDVEGEVLAELEVDEAPSVGATVYFGLTLPIEEIAEVKALVTGSTPSGGGHVVTVKALAADSRFKALAVKTLTGGEAGGGEKGAGPLWAKGLRQTNGTYAILVNAPAGLITAAQLEKIADVANKNAGVIKLTHAQRIVILASADMMDSIEVDLGSIGLKVGVLHHGIRNIRACCGALCKWAKGIDAIQAAIDIDKALYGRGTNFDVKIAVSDCLRNCSESYCADIGLIGGDGSYSVVVGGRGAQIPFRAIQFTSGVPQAELPSVVIRIVEWYTKTAAPKERLSKTLERLGTPAVQDADLSALKAVASSLSDGVDEVERLKSHLARLAGAVIARKELGLTR